jgi:hypothetical protein
MRQCGICGAAVAFDAWFALHLDLYAPPRGGHSEQYSAVLCPACANKLAERRAGENPIRRIYEALR